MRSLLPVRCLLRRLAAAAISPTSRLWRAPSAAQHSYLSLRRTHSTSALQLALASPQARRALSHAAAASHATMQQTLQPSGAAPQAPLQVQLAQPFQGPLNAMQRQPTVLELQALLQQAHDAALSHTAVHNIPKLCRRILRDLKFLESHAAALGGSSTAAQQLDQSRLQGIVNNLRGFHGELLAMQEAPGVVAVCKRFSTQPPASPWLSQSTAAARTATASTAAASTAVAVSAGDPASSGSEGSDAADDTDDDGLNEEVEEQLGTITVASTGGTMVAAGLGQGADVQVAAGAIISTMAAAGLQQGSNTEAVEVEVDVVANGGHTWIEVKNQEPFGLYSVHMAGCPGKNKGLRQQIEHLLQAAHAPHNMRSWRAPEVVVFFPTGVHASVAEELQRMGAKVAEGLGSLAGLTPPPEPLCTNLDVTTLCALVSGVTHQGGDEGSELLEAWASKTIHWQECLEAERQQPLLPKLLPFVGKDRRLVAAAHAVRQFEKLVSGFGGPGERQRWQALKARLEVCEDGSSSATMPSSRSASNGCSAGGGGSYRAVPGNTTVGVVSQVTGTSGPVTTHSNGNGSQSAGNGTAISAGTSSSATHDCILQGSGTKHTESNSATAGMKGGSPWSCCTGGAAQQAARITKLPKLTALQRAVFALGAGQMAVTLTANGAAVRSAAQEGVQLEAVVHRPVWLTGT